MKKQVLPESFGFDVPSVELIGAYSGGLHKEAMVKRAAAFDNVIAELKPKKGYEYLHVITTGAFEKYGANLNGDAYNGKSFQHTAPMPKEGCAKVIVLDGGLTKYHNDTYMKDGAVFQEHKTRRNGVDPSGFIVAADYNEPMQRGELIIAVDSDKWAKRLQRKASGENIYLSIGCDVAHDQCFPAGTLVMTQVGYIPIEHIKVGDIVLTGEGNWQPVTGTMHRESTEFTRLLIAGIPLELECTPNHPILHVPEKLLRSCHGSSVRIGKPRHTPDESGICKRCGKHVDIKREWIKAGDLKINDYVAIKLDTNAECNRVGESFAYLCGMYLGDGSTIWGTHGNTAGVYIKAVNGIEISASAAEKDACILKKITDAYTAVTGKEAKVVPESGGKNAYKVTLNDKLLASRILELCGSYSRYKYISKDILGWSVAEKAALLAGLVDSDGCFDPAHNAVRIVTINRGMLLGVQRLCWSVGIPATLFVGHSEGAQSSFGTPTMSYAVGFRTTTPSLIKYSAKLARAEAAPKKANGPQILLHKGYAYLRLDAVRTFSGEVRPVYNLEVAGDHTYNAEGLDVHNCNICHNIAHTMDEHCDHFKKHRLRVYDNGEVSCVFNDAPHFYDISGVDVPADKIAFVLSKVASGECTRKEASVMADYTFSSRKPMPFNKAARMLEKLSNMEKELVCQVADDSAMDESAEDDTKKKDFLLQVENYPADEIISCCNRCGILLTPDMLFALLAKEDPSKELVRCSDYCHDIDTANLFSRLHEDEDFYDELYDGAFDQVLPVDLELLDIINKARRDFGVKPSDVGGRVIIMELHGTPKKQHKEAAHKTAANHEVVEALTHTYGRYVLGFAAQNDNDTCRLALRKLARLQ